MPSLQVPGNRTRALCMLSKHSPAEPHPSLTSLRLICIVNRKVICSTWGLPVFSVSAGFERLFANNLSQTDTEEAVTHYGKHS